MKEQTIMPEVNKEDIVSGLRELGLKAAMGLMVHSSLKSFGQVKGGVQTVIKALMDVLTPEGTLMMPSFNHDRPFRKEGPGYYDPKETPTSNGKIPDTFWRMPDVYRSLNPSHPFAAWGKNAQRFTEKHHRTLTMGTGSPLGLLWKSGGYCLLIGVDYRPNSFHHVVEMSTGAPCLGQRTEACTVKLPDGRLVEARTWGWREKACPLTDHVLYSNEMASQGLHKQILIGKSLLTLFKLQDCFEVASDLLRKGRNDVSPCSECTIRPRTSPHAVPSDWDKEKGSLLPGSPALKY